MNKREENSEKFYGAVSEYYDEMTRFDERFEDEKTILSRWREHYPFQKVLDTACGTGLHAIICSLLGAEVTAADSSAEMLRKAKRNAFRHQVKIKWIKSRMQDLDKHISQRFDIILCLGNSLPHLLTANELDQTVRNFHQILEPDGRLILQLLNYEKIMKEKNRIIGVQKSGKNEFIRFYDFLDEMIVFNILQIQWQNSNASHRLTSTSLYPYTQANLEPALKKFGFSEFQLFGNMKFAAFDATSSHNLVVVAKRTK